MNIFSQTSTRIYASSLPYEGSETCPCRSTAPNILPFLEGEIPSGGSRCVCNGGDASLLGWTIVRSLLVVSAWSPFSESVVRFPHFLDDWPILYIDLEFRMNKWLQGISNLQKELILIILGWTAIFLKGSFSCKRGFSLLNFERGLKKTMGCLILKLYVVIILYWRMLQC